MTDAMSTSPDGKSKLTGLEQLRRAVSGNAAPFGKLLGFKLESAEFGTVTFEAAPAAEHYNPHGVVHGGYASSLLDSAMGCAVQSMLEADEAYTTIELKVNFVRAMTRETGQVKVIGTIVHRGRRIATADGRLVDKNGKLIAHGSTTCMILSS
jgi:uncharacterized protein (TIGR00369 family)